MVNKRRKPRPKQSEDDPLGELMSHYHVSLAGVLLVAGVLACVGLGLLGYALTRESTSVMFVLAGIGALVVAVGLLGTNLLNVGRRLEVRKRGLRYVEPGFQIELLWKDIVDVQVNRTDETDVGMATVRKRGVHYARPAGLLTSTEWDIRIRGCDGRSIHLSPTFLKIVPDVPRFVSQLRLRAGT